MAGIRFEVIGGLISSFDFLNVFISDKEDRLGVFVEGRIFSDDVVEALQESLSRITRHYRSALLEGLQDFVFILRNKITFLYDNVVWQRKVVLDLSFYLAEHLCCELSLGES